MSFRLRLPPQLRKREAATPPPSATRPAEKAPAVTATMPRPLDEPPEEPPCELWEEPPTTTATTGTPATATPSGSARPVVYLYDGRVATDEQIMAIADLCDFDHESNGRGITGKELLRKLGAIGMDGGPAW
jgi:hypothetical protein